ncbi:hypothetical protein [Actinoplanes solisilvae]|uniref:hypothetical protein n=1 Tax=Actinoplanes solisilvae TaxID=2486853 RepID=UPI000FD94034|nr:hypothetical protein [Actinoplanes solisilvae]
MSLGGFRHPRVRDPTPPTVRIVTNAGAGDLAAGLLQLVAAVVIGVPMGHPFGMWLLLTGSIAAAGMGALSVFAVFGSPGALINAFFFVALALASGPAVPPEAAGLTYAWAHLAVGGAVGLTLGLVGTWFYDRNPRFSRHPRPAPEPSPPARARQSPASTV